MYIVLYITIHYDGVIGQPVGPDFATVFEIPKTIDRVACEILFEYYKFKKNLLKTRSVPPIAKALGFQKH